MKKLPLCNKTFKQLNAELDLTKKKYGLVGGLMQTKKIPEGWLVAIIFGNKSSGYQHWNYHPGRTELTKTHETIGTDAITALDDTIKALERLYA